MTLQSRKISKKIDFWVFISAIFIFLHVSKSFFKFLKNQAKIDMPYSTTPERYFQTHCIFCTISHIFNVIWCTIALLHCERYYLANYAPANDHTRQEIATGHAQGHIRERRHICTKGKFFKSVDTYSLAF